MSCQLGDGWCGAPALGPGGTVYVASFDESTSSASSNSLYQVTSGGALNWSLHGSFVSSVASFDVSGTAYFSGGCGITAVDASGNVKWTLGVAKHYLGNEFYWTYASQPAVANNGTIYFWSYDGLRAVSPAGKLKWFYPYTATTSTQEDLFTPAVGPDGTVYFADHNLYAVAPDGTLKWSKYYGDWLVAVCPAIAQDGTLYTITIGETGPQAILAINPDGSEKWSSTQAEPWKTITLDAKGNLYTIVFKQLASLTSSGAPGNSFGGTTDAWFVVAGDGTACYRDSTTNDIVINGGHSMGSDWEPFAMASDDTVYGITATGGALRAYNSEGVLLWSLPELAYWTSAAGSGLGFTAQNVIPSTDRPFSIALNGSLYVRTINGFVVVK